MLLLRVAVAFFALSAGLGHAQGWPTKPVRLIFDLVSSLLVYNDGTFNVNIWTAIDDIPAIVDVNRDGDLDMLTFGIFGASVEYYENQTMEHQGNPAYAYDSLKYVDVTLCWGNFTESALTNSVNLNASCKGGSGGGVPTEVEDGARHSGSTLFDIDFNNDHDVDLLLGDISYNNLVLVQNCGDSSSANICSYDTIFPACNAAVNMPVFPAAFSVEIGRAHV